MQSLLVHSSSTRLLDALLFAGLDKFKYSVDWTIILHLDGRLLLLPRPSLWALLEEIGAGMVVTVLIGALVVSGWLVLIALTLIVSGLMSAEGVMHGAPSQAKTTPI